MNKKRVDFNNNGDIYIQDGGAGKYILYSNDGKMRVLLYLRRGNNPTSRQTFRKTRHNRTVRSLVEVRHMTKTPQTDEKSVFNPQKIYKAFRDFISSAKNRKEIKDYAREKSKTKEDN